MVNAYMLCLCSLLLIGGVAADWRGATLVFAGLGSLVYGLIAASALGWRSVLVITALIAGAILLLAFVWHEQRSAAPMMPLALFRSRNVSSLSALTLLLYGALGGALFFVPFLLIEAHGYSAAAAGATFLPFTVVLGALSKWSGSLVDRVGTRLPLMTRPVILAVGFALMAWAAARTCTGCSSFR